MMDYVAIIVAFITGVIGPILVMYFKNRLDRTQKPDMVMETLHVSELVNAKIEDIREEYGADRVWVTQFHNGGNFYPTGKSMAKFSIIYETVGLKVSSVQGNFHNIPVNLFSKSINELLKNDAIRIPDYKDESVATFGLKYIAEDTGCKSGYLFAIKSIDDKFIGTLGLDFTKKKVKLNDEEITNLKLRATSLGGVLMTHLSH